MPIPELLYRVKDLVLSYFEYSFRKKWRHGYLNNVGDVSPIPFLTKLDNGFCKKYAHEFEKNVEDITKGKLYFQGEKYNLGRPLKWHHDYQTDTTLPLIRGRKYYSLGIYSKANMNFIRFINRHTYLVYLAIYVGMTGKRAEDLKKYMRCWIVNNPYLEGVNWSDSWQIGARIINWSLIISFAYEELSKNKNFIEEVGSSMIEQAAFIRKHHSKFSSANNHLLLELISCAFAAILFPSSNYTKIFGSKIISDLEQEVQRQYYDDGFHFEQSVAYHWYTLNYLLLFVRSASESQYNLSNLTQKKIKQAFEALSFFNLPAGAIPQIGDGGFENSYYTFYLFHPDTNNYTSLLYQASIYFNESKWKRGINSPDPRTTLVYGGKIPKNYSCYIKTEPPKQLYDAGYYILQGQFNNGVVYRVIFDAGPFGLEPTFAHAHADSLSFLVDLNGSPFLIDPGTYLYHPKDKKWRNYFRGTSGHNTVRIDQQDQAVSGGNMLWLSEPKTTLLNYQELEGDVFIEAKHDGYSRLKDPVIHKRSIQINNGFNSILVKDSLSCKNEHKADIFYHFNNDYHLKKSTENTCVAYNNSFRINIVINKAKNILIKNGDPAMPIGWQSLEWNTKKPVSALQIEDEFKGDYVTETAFCIDVK